MAKDNILDQTFGKDDIAVLKTSLAYDGESRKAGESYDITINVNLAGVSVRDLTEKALSQKAVEFQRPRRSADKGGNVESKEHFDEMIKGYEEQDFTLDMHYSQIGATPKKKKTPEELDAELDQITAQMSPEQLEAALAKLTGG